MRYIYCYLYSFCFVVLDVYYNIYSTYIVVF